MSEYSGRSQSDAYRNRKGAITRKRVSVDDNFRDNERFVSRAYTPDYKEYLQKKETDSVDLSSGVQCRLHEVVIKDNEKRIYEKQVSGEAFHTKGKAGWMGGGGHNKNGNNAAAEELALHSVIQSEYKSKDGRLLTDLKLAEPLRATTRFSPDDLVIKEVWYSSSASKRGIGQRGPLFADEETRRRNNVADGESRLGLGPEFNEFDPTCEGVRIPVFASATEISTVAAVLRTKLLLGFSPLTANSAMPAQVVVTSTPEIGACSEASVVVNWNETVFPAPSASAATSSAGHCSSFLNPKIQASLRALKTIGSSLYIGGGKTVLIGNPQIVRFAVCSTTGGDHDLCLNEERLESLKSEPKMDSAESLEQVQNDESLHTAQQQSSECDAAGHSSPYSYSSSSTSVLSDNFDPSRHTRVVSDEKVPFAVSGGEDGVVVETSVARIEPPKPLFSPLFLPDVEYTTILRSVPASIGQIKDRLEMLERFGFINYVDTGRHGDHTLKIYKQAHRLINREFEGFLKVHLTLLTTGFGPLLHELKEAFSALDTDFGVHGSSSSSASKLSHNGMYVPNFSAEAAAKRKFNPWRQLESRVSPFVNDVLRWIEGEMKDLGMSPSHPRQLLEIIQIAAGNAEILDKRRRPTSGLIGNKKGRLGDTKALDPAGIIREAIHRHVLLDVVHSLSDVHWNSYASLRLKVLGPAVAVGDIVAAKKLPESANDNPIDFNDRFDMGAADIPRDYIPSTDDHYSPRWGHFVDGGGASESTTAIVSPFMRDPAPITSLAEYNESLFARGILKIVESRREASQYELFDVVLPKIGRTEVRHDEDGSHSTPHLFFPKNKLGKETFDELASRLKVESLPSMKLAPWATYRRLVEKPLPMPPERYGGVASSVSMSAFDAREEVRPRVLYASWNDTRGIADDPYDILRSSSLLVSDDEGFRRIRNPITGDEPPRARRSIRDASSREAFLAHAKDKLSVLICCRLRRGAALQSLLREPFAPKFLNSERLWALGVGEAAITKSTSQKAMNFKPRAYSNGEKVKSYLR